MLRRRRVEQRIDLIELQVRSDALAHLEPIDLSDRVAVDVAALECCAHHLLEPGAGLVDRPVGEATVLLGLVEPPDQDDCEIAAIERRHRARARARVEAWKGRCPLSTQPHGSRSRGAARGFASRPPGPGRTSLPSPSRGSKRCRRRLAEPNRRQPPSIAALGAPRPRSLPGSGLRPHRAPPRQRSPPLMSGIEHTLSTPTSPKGRDVSLPAACCKIGASGLRRMGSS